MKNMIIYAIYMDQLSDTGPESVGHSYLGQAPIRQYVAVDINLRCRVSQRGSHFELSPQASTGRNCSAAL